MPTTRTEAAESEGLVHDPYAYFESLSESAQDKTFGKAQAQAIRDGADFLVPGRERLPWHVLAWRVVGWGRGGARGGGLDFTREGTTSALYGWR